MPKRKSTSYGGSKHLRMRTGVFEKTSSRLRISKQSTTGLEYMNQMGRLGFEQRDLMSLGEDFDGGEDDWLPLPPGEEGMLESHAGGELNLYNEILLQARGKRSDYRTRNDRTHLRSEAWKAQVQPLARAFLSWRYGPREEENAFGEWMEVSVDEEEAICDQDRSSVIVVDMFRKCTISLRPQPETDDKDFLWNVELVKRGCLGASPRLPNVAITLRTLAAFRQLHNVTPKLSIHAFVHSLCNMHETNFQSYLVKQFSTTFDAYLMVMHQVDLLCDSALGRDSEYWRALNVCPPCMYKLEDEPQLKYNMLCAIDGNSSLKLVAMNYRHGTELRDERKRRADFWVSEGEVDRFKDDVRNKNKEKSALASQASATQISSTQTTSMERTQNSQADDDDAWVGVAESSCTDRWRNAGPESRKKMFELFAVSGVFVAVCRHAHLLFLCDMIKSGELMKYPLAIVDKLMDIYGENLVVGYDIGCAFSKTVEHSSIADKARQKNLDFVVPAFHGHAHNRGCQVNYHPLYREGIGKDDLETCERTFSASNALASSTRMASRFHRNQAIEEHFAHWSCEKHAESGNFIYQNYQQALDIINTNQQILDAVFNKRGITSADYQRFLVAEREYLRSRKIEPSEVLLTADYMEKLQKLNVLSKEACTAKIAFDETEQSHLWLGQLNGPSTSKIRAKYTSAVNRWTALNEEVCLMEADLGIETRWLPESVQYRAALMLLNERKYRVALDKVERLVVQRMFELAKLGISGVGYKLREKIGKALRTRFSAIKSALEEYNGLAVAMNPPRQMLTWETVIETTNLAELDLLRDTRLDIRTLDWAQPENRRAAGLFFQVERAREEIERLNIEIRRLLTAMVDEHFDYSSAIASTLLCDESLAWELARRWKKRDAINAQIAERLRLTSLLTGFTGTFLTGKRLARNAQAAASLPLPTWITASHSGDQTGGDVGELDDNEGSGEEGGSPGDGVRDANKLLSFMENMGSDK